MIRPTRSSPAPETALRRTWRTVTPEQLPGLLAGWLAREPGLVRVAVDGAPTARPIELAEQLVAPLRAAGRQAVVVDARFFWHDASLRLEHGHQDVDSYLHWLDADALRREVLQPAGARQTYLPSLRDPRTNRATREPPRSLAADAVLIVSGSLLLGRALPFDRSIHLHLPAPRLAELVCASQQWTLPAFARYEASVHPAENADIVARPGRGQIAVGGLVAVAAGGLP